MNPLILVIFSCLVITVHVALSAVSIWKQYEPVFSRRDQERFETLKKVNLAFSFFVFALMLLGPNLSITDFPSVSPPIFIVALLNLGLIVVNFSGYFIQSPEYRQHIPTLHIFSGLGNLVFSALFTFSILRSNVAI